MLNNLERPINSNPRSNCHEFIPAHTRVIDTLVNRIDERVLNVRLGEARRQARNAR